MTTSAEIQYVLNEHPDLGLFGFGTTAPVTNGDFLRQVDTARQWLQKPQGIAAGVRYGSYGVKHMIERDTNTYVSNGAAIVAAALVGFSIQRSKRPGPNCWFRRTA